MPKIKDPELQEFEAALLRSVDQAVRSEHGAVHTPEEMESRKRGRPVGSVKDNPKVPTTIRFDADVLSALKGLGRGWQTRVNDQIRADIKAGRLKV